MKIEDGESLRNAVADYLGDTQLADFPSPEEFRRLPVDLDRHGRICIGSWVLEPASQTLTDHVTPDQRGGYDRIIHVAGQGRDWKVERVSRIEVFGADGGVR